MASTTGRRVVEYLTNKSGGAVAAGDVVIIDTTNNEAFTTTTTGAYTGLIGVAQEAIANNSSGRVCTAGYVGLVNVNASVTRGNFGKTHTAVKQATDAGSSRVAGAFCEFLTGGTTPTAHLFGMPDATAASSPTYSSWTPTLTADGGNPALGSGGSATGRYTQVGKLVHAYGRVVFGSSGVSAGSGVYEFALPVTAASDASSTSTVYGSAVLYDDSTATFTQATVYWLDSGEVRIVISAATNFQVTNAVPWTWAANDQIILSMTYEAA